MANALDSSNFSASTTDIWKARVEKELKDKSFNDFLIWNSLDGFEIEAWQNMPPTIQCQLPPLNSPWLLMSLISEQDAQTANKSALMELMTGSQSIWFTKSFQGAAEAVITNGIDQSVASVFIAGNTICDPYHTLLKTGQISKKDFAHKMVLFDGNRLRERGCNIVQEIALLISQAIEWSSINGFDSEIYFKVANGSGYLSEISKIRALRWLWTSILKRENSRVINPKIIAANLNIGYSKSDEHTNILRATTAAMSAISGGSQYIMIQPWDQEWKERNEFSSRISRNIQNLLKDESHMAANLNPADGSYFIENLTTAIAEKAWTIIQDIEVKGGFTNYATSGGLKNDIVQSRNQLTEAFASDSKVLLNANKYKSEDQVAEVNPNKSSYQLLPSYLHLPTEINQ